MTDISSILSNSDNNFHVFGFSESRLGEHVTNTDIAIPGYLTIRNDPQKSGETGLLVYVSESVTFKRLTHLETHSVESLWIEIKLKKSSPLLIGFCYRNPAERASWSDNFISMMDAVLLESKETVILGDFNIDLLKPHKPWSDKIDLLYLSQLIQTPTRVTSTSKTLIDHIYVSEKRNILETCVPVFGCSDHYPVCLTWSRKGIKIPKAGHKTITYRSFSKFNEDNFLSDLASSPLSNVYNFNDPEKAIECWHTNFLNVYNKHAPFRTKRVKHITKPKWIDKELDDAMKYRDFLKSVNQDEEYKAQRNKVNSMKRSKKKHYFSELISSKQNPKLVWKAINELTNKTSGTRSAQVKDLSVDDLNTHFCSIADKVITTDKTKQNDLEVLKEYCKSKNINSSLEIPLITVSEVFHALIHLKQTGTRGIDGLDGKILKLSAPVIVDTLTYIYNLCIDQCYFPSAFKQAKVVPLFKSGATSDPANYRPISILSPLSKPLEKHMNKYILEHLNSNDLLHPNQSGFRKDHSCHTALTQLVDKWLLSINNNEFCGAVFVDFAKAFDVIDHKLLVKKLGLYGLSSKSLNLVTSFLTNRQQSVHANSFTSDIQSLKYGVPQGSVLGPLLFSVYINDLPLFIESICELFADDTSIHSSSKNLTTLSGELQRSIDKLTEWSELNHMSLNPTKTKCMLITTRQKRQLLPSTLPPLCVNNQLVEEVESHKVLGVTIDNNLSWSHHINALCKTTSKKVFQLTKIKHFLNLYTRKLFFQAHIQSSMDYASTLWDSSSANTLKPLVSLHKRAVKAVLLKSTTLTKTDYKQLEFLPLKQRFTYNKGVIMHRLASGSGPPALTSKFEISSRHSNKFTTGPCPRVDLFKSSLLYSGSVLWNSLPESLRDPMTENAFKSRYSAYLKGILAI